MRRLLYTIGCFLGLGLAAHAQAGAVSAFTPSPAAAVAQVTLGHAAVALYGPWRFHIGDNPAWAQPAFDDAHWGSMDLHSPDAPADSDFGTGSDVPGWTSQGYPNHSGFAWYRLQINLNQTAGPVSLEMPEDVDDAYQVFVNGQEIGSFGHFGKHRVMAYTAQPRGFHFPKGLRSGTAVIAIRMWMDSASRFETPDAGGMHGPPMLGLAPIISKDVRLDWDSVDHEIGSGFLEGLVLLLALTVSLTLYWLHREEKSYLWLGFVALATLLANLVLQLSNFTTLIPQTIAVIVRDVALAPLRIGLWVLFWEAWFCLGWRRWLPRCVWALVAVLAIGTAMLRPPLHGQFVPLHAGAYLHPLLLWTKLILAGVLFFVAAKGIRKSRLEGWLALPAVLLSVVANYQMELRLLHLPIFYTVLGYQVSLGQISTMLSFLLVTVLLSRRYLHAQRRKAQWEIEMTQARELQRLIVPSTLPQVPGLSIQAEYRPSLDVSGDFFQVIPDQATSSVLIVVGDVTGKGLRAGMVVALLLGTLDALAKEETDPARLLTRLNNQLCYRGYATATCMLIRITAEGLVSIANAGHLPPYLNGAEMMVEGALPVGTLPDLEYDATHFRLEDGDTLMLMTDGIVEATNAEGDLFGFARIAEMVTAGASARDVADAAQRFGQEDDILVLRVERTVAHSVFISAAA